VFFYEAGFPEWQTVDGCRPVVFDQTRHREYQVMLA